MDENLLQNEIQLSRKEKILKFYKKNKIFIFSFLVAAVIIFVFAVLYMESKERDKKIIAENYITAKIYLENENKDKAKNMLKQIIFLDDPTYSTLSLFLILNENLINNKEEKLKLFEHILEKNNYDKEVKNLIIFKKALYESNFVNESDLLNSLKSLINRETIWKPHVLLLLGDYFYSKNENKKAAEFYSQILLIKNIDKNFYFQARSQLALMLND